jgi:hypothetical protein
MSDLDCAAVRERLEAYALGALERDESAAVERHLAACADCRRVAEELAGVAHGLPVALAAASPLRPPTALRERVLAAVPGATEPSRDRRGLRVSRRALVLALAATVLAGALAWAAGLQIALARERDRRAELASLIHQQELYFELADSPRTEKLFLRSVGGRFARSYGKVYTRPDLPDVVAFAARLPRADAGRAYHLWLTQDGRVTLAGVLTIRDGFGVVVFRADAPGPRFDVAELTLQAPGARAPGGVPVLSWREASSAAAAS